MKNIGNRPRFLPYIRAKQHENRGLSPIVLLFLCPLLFPIVPAPIISFVFRMAQLLKAIFLLIDSALPQHL
jgi:hypothetical protein